MSGDPGGPQGHSDLSGHERGVSRAEDLPRLQHRKPYSYESVEERPRGIASYGATER